MSEPKLISPMLDNFVMGAPISDHHGVRCCPAMTKDSDNKYIVKILSIPASRVQLEALLLTGAYPSEDSALSYFKELADGVQEEVNILNKLSKLEGFIPYENCQIVPMENDVGYDVYLLSPYKHSLERFFRKNTMTHLGAVNLGLDMCASLAVCRQSGYLYVDLKPDNIFISQDQEYRIGDLGFVKLDSLKYASLPDKYHSAYTAPEITDAFSSLNTTIDVYAAGMILYQAYNGGVLPFEDQAPAESLPAPVFADYEMAEIILKACDPDPALRWQDPIQMGQALVSYMQRNGANDTPIVPAPIEEPDEPANVQEEIPEEVTEKIAEDIPQEISTEETADGQICLDAFNEEAEQEPVPEDMEAPAEPEDLSPEDDEDLTILETDSDETVPSEETAEDVSYEELSEEMSDILTQADDLISHEAPEPVIVPEPMEITIPEPLPVEETPVQVETTTEEDIPTEEASEDAAKEPDSTDAEDLLEEEYEDEYEEEYDSQEKFSGKKILAIVLALLLLAGLAFGGYIYYRDYYLQTVTSLTLNGSEDQLRVSVTTDVDEALLKVVCVDTYGTKLEQPVENGVAVFTGLNPNTLYSVRVEVSGLRKLTGETSDSYSTPVQTGIVSLNAVTGSEGGTAIISFAVEGNDAESWTVSYVAEGEEVITHTFTGHMATITGLTVGKTYTFDLSSESDVFLTGTTQIEYTAAEPVFAEGVAAVGSDNDSIDVAWSIPEGAVASNWIVRCYNDSGYDQTLTVSDSVATFTGIDTQQAYTIEVTAEGMSTGVRSYVSANAVTVTGAAAEVKSPAAIAVSWDCADTSVTEWLVVYSVDGLSQQEIIRTNTTSAVISPIVPGATYTISIQLDDGSTVLGGNLTVTVPQADAFNGQALGYIVKDTPMEFSMCIKPDMVDWSNADVTSYTDSFAVGQKAAFVVYIPGQYNTQEDAITSLFVIRDESGSLVSYASTTSPWHAMWFRRYCELDVPTLPDAPGSYTIEVYFNGLLAHQQGFTVS